MSKDRGFVEGLESLQKLTLPVCDAIGTPAAFSAPGPRCGHAASRAEQPCWQMCGTGQRERHEGKQ